MRPIFGAKLLFFFLFLVVLTEAFPRSTRRNNRRTRSRCPKPVVPNGSARIRSNGRTVRFRCNRGYTLVGKNIAVCLKNKEWNRPSPVCAGQGCRIPKTEEKLIVNRTYSGAILRFSCPVGFMRKGPQTVVCNDRDWSDSAPECTRLSSANRNCDFEDKYICGWTNDADDDFDWKRHSGKTPTDSTGPDSDHTKRTQDGHYMFMESSSPQRFGHIAKLKSPVYRPEEVEGFCFEFFYHMFGPNDSGQVGELDLSVLPVESDTEDVSKNLFKRAGNQGNVWLKGDVDIPQMKSPLQLVFKATRLRGYISDIAIDDLRFFNCSKRLKPTIPITTIPSTTTSTTSTTTTPSTTTSTTSTTTTPSTTTSAATTSTTTTTTTTTTPTTTTTTTTIPTTQSTTSTPTTAKPTTTTTTMTTNTTPTTTSATNADSTSTTTTTTTTTSTSVTLTTEDTAFSTTTTSTSATPTTANTAFSTKTTRTRIAIEEEPVTKRRSSTTDSVQSPPTTSHTDNNKNATNKTMGGHIDTAQNPIIDFVNDSDNNTNVSLRNKSHDQAMHDGTVAGASVTVHTGEVRETSGTEKKSILQQMPLIIGVAAGVFVAAVIISIIAYTASRKERKKQQKKEEEEHMNIITEFVEHSFNS